MNDFFYQQKLDFCTAFEMDPNPSPEDPNHFKPYSRQWFHYHYDDIMSIAGSPESGLITVFKKNGYIDFYKFDVKVSLTNIAYYKDGKEIENVPFGGNNMISKVGGLPPIVFPEDLQIEADILFKRIINEHANEVFLYDKNTHSYSIDLEMFGYASMKVYDKMRQESEWEEKKKEVA